MITQYGKSLLPHPPNMSSYFISRAWLAVPCACAMLPFISGCSAATRSSSSRVSPSSPSDARAAEHAVDSVYRAGIEAFNRHDLAEFTAGFADDIAMYTPTGWLHGRGEVDQRFRETFTRFPNVRMVIDSLEVRAIGPRTTTVAFRWRVHPMGQGPAFHGVGSGVYVLRDGRWREVLEHETVTLTDAALTQR